MSHKNTAPPHKAGEHKTHEDYINFLGLGKITKRDAFVNTIAALGTAAVLVMLMFAYWSCTGVAL